jgi:hypothetical protein
VYITASAPLTAGLAASLAGSGFHALATVVSASTLIMAALAAVKLIPRRP